MFSFRALNKALSKVGNISSPQLLQCAGIKNFPPPIVYGDIEFSERPKLKIMEKVPQYTNNLKPPKMTKRLMLMRGPEKVHNTLLHKQYGIMATQGGRLKHPHYEMIRLSIGRKLDINRMFAIWRVPAPWQPISKKGQGMRMGGGKSAIDHYATPIRAGRIIIEVAGRCEYAEVKDFLKVVADRMPFAAIPVSYEILQNIETKKLEDEKNNLNPYTKKYVIQNNLNGCHNWVAPTDHKWFGEYL